LSGQYFEADAALGDVLRRVHQMLEVAPQSIDLPNDERIALAQSLQAGGEGRAVVVLARGPVIVEVVRIDAGRDQRVALQVEPLAAVGFGDAGVSNAYVSPRCQAAVMSSRNRRAVIIRMVS
jgi:hypothetical protein